MPFKENFDVKPLLPAIEVPDNPHFFNNTQFQFNEESQRLDYGTAMGIEMSLMQDLLKAGYASLAEQYSDAGEVVVSANQRRLAENLHMLQLQRDEILRGDSENELTPRAPTSPAQSPRGTTAAIPDAGGNVNLTPTGRTSKPIDPTCKPFEPRRRLSEPRQAGAVFGDSPVYSPLRRRTSSLLSFPFADDTPATDSPRKRIDYATPTKGKRGGARVSVDHTIHEENDEDLFLAINRQNLHQDLNEESQVGSKLPRPF
jgi:hypothetical protein